MKKVCVTLAISLALIIALALSIRVAAVVPFQGDSVAHVNIAAQFVEDGSISSHIHNLAYSDSGRPITYPLLYHTLLALDWLFMGEGGVRYISCLLGVLICITIFLLTRWLTRSAWWGVFAILLVISVSEFYRFSSFVFMETLLAFFCLLALYVLVKVLYESGKVLLLLGLLIGGAIAVKTPGFILLVALPLSLYTSRNLRVTARIVLGVLLVTVLFLGYQLQTNGTILDPGMAEKLQPHSKLGEMTNTECLEAWEEAPIEQSRIEYARSFEGVKAFLFADNIPDVLAVLLLLLVLLSPFYVGRRLRGPAILLLSLLSVAFVAYQFVPNERYLFSYRLLSVVVLVLALSKLVDFFRPFKRSKYIGLPMLVLIVVGCIVLGVSGSNSWQNQQDRIIYQATRAGGYANLIEAAHWLTDNSPEDAIICGSPEEDIAYYSDRTVFWLSPYAGVEIPTLVSTHSESLALEICEKYTISYLWIGHYQIKEVAHPQFFPEDGIIAVIDHFERFDLAFRNNEISIYRVVNESR